MDAYGGIAIDPTANVIAMTEATVRRLDDLRAAAVQRTDDLRKSENKLVKAEIRHVQFVADLRATHSKEMRQLESARLDAIRQVDVAARTTEAARALDAIQALERTTAANADNLRSLVSSTAATLAASNLESDKQLIERISQLERTSFVGQGKEAVASPAMDELIREVKALRTIRSTDTGRGEGATDLWKIIASVVGVAVTVGSVLFALLK